MDEYMNGIFMIMKLKKPSHKGRFFYLPSVRAAAST